MRAMVCMLALVIISSCAAPIKSIAGGKVKGNGNIITEEIQISQFDVLEIGSGIGNGTSFGKKGIPTFNYTQSNEKATLKVTTDSNILPLLKIESSKGRLIISSKDRQQLQPTRLVIEGKSSELSELNVSGLMDFYVENNFSGEKLKIRGTGSSDIYFNKKVSLKACEIQVNGSGDFHSKDLQTGTITCKVSGSGDILLNGKAEEASFTASGSGDINAYGFEVKDLKCSVSGSSDVKVYVTHNLDASVSGSGDIRYIGDPSVDKRVSGSGSIKQGK